MSSSASVILVLAGIIAGVLLATLFLWALSFAPWRGRAGRTMSNADLQRGIIDTFALIDVPAVLVDAQCGVLAASEAALSLAMLGGGRITDPELVGIVRDALASRDVVTRQVEIGRGPYADVTIAVEVRAVRLSKKRALVYLADRSDFQRIEQVRRDFMANISHELKTPIGAISLLAEAIREASDEPERVAAFAERLTSETERLATITQEIIELSRLESNASVAAYEPTDVDNIVRLAVDQNATTASAHRVSVVVGEPSQAKVLADEPRLIMAVSNLISNAIQYSREGGKVGVGVTATKKKVEISVTDQGIGMTPDEVERVFERFYRTDQARSRATGGSGLGLAIVKHVVGHHGGDVRVWSAPSEGSTFTIRLPRFLESDKEG